MGVQGFMCPASAALPAKTPLCQTRPHLRVLTAIVITCKSCKISVFNFMNAPEQPSQRNDTQQKRGTSSHAKYIKLLFLVLLVMTTMLGCGGQNQVQIMQVGTLKVEKPSTWEMDYHERSGLTKMNTVSGNHSAYLWFSLGVHITDDTSYTLEEAMEFETERFSWVYNLETEPLIQEEFMSNDTYTATVLIPTLALPINWIDNQVGVQSENVFQLVELHLFKCNNFFIRSAIYKGNSDQLNMEAIAIIESIKSLNCHSTFQE
jgi:hypothetical protein